MSPVSRDPLLGALLDERYLISSLIARGGMASVYLANDQRLDRDVAVKVMHPHLADDEQFVARFIREAKSAARISHPNAVSVYDQGREVETVYLVMEYVPGVTLRDVLREHGALTPGQALDVMIPVLGALAAAHRAGLVHRDVKPENVLVGSEDPDELGSGVVKVADFGLARRDTSSTATTGVLIGTAAYLSPELVSRGIADARSDVYSAGIMLFEMVTGRPPFDGDVAWQVAMQHLNDEVPLPSSVDPSLPPALDALVDVATANDPDERPHDAGEFLAQVQRTRLDLSDSQLSHQPRPQRTPVQHTQRIDVAAATTGTPSGPRGPSRFPTANHGQTQGPKPGPNFTRPNPVVPQRPRTLEQPVVEPAAPRRRNRASIWLAALVVLLLVAGGTGYYFTAGPGSYQTMPKVTGTQAQAEAALAKAGLTGNFESAYNETVATGQVVSTDPAAGANVRKRSTVTVTVSAGTAYLALPSLSGKTLDEAKQALESNDLKLGTVTNVYSDSVASGKLVDTAPKAKARVKHGDTVNLNVSQGPAPVNIPDVTNKPLAEIQKTLAGLGLKLKTTEEFNDSVPKGSVIKQDPGAGNGHRGDTINLVISKGPQLVQVPSVVGKQADEAERILKEAGFQVSRNNVMGGYFGTVRSQSPDGNQQAPAGSTVTITVV